MLVSGISRGVAWAHPLFLNQAEAKAPKIFFPRPGISIISGSGSATGWSLLGLKKG